VWCECVWCVCGVSVYGVSGNYSMDTNRSRLLKLLDQSRSTPHFVQPARSSPYSQDTKLLTILGRVNPAHKLSSYSFPVHFNIFFLSTRKLSCRFMSFTFSNENPTRNSFPFRAFHVPLHPVLHVLFIPKIIDCE